MASGAKLKETGGSVRMFLVGHPGSGKTGALASLANAGYKLRVIDFEGNFAPLLEFVDERALTNIDIVTLQDRLRSGDGDIVPSGIPTAFNEALELLKRWKYKDGDEEVDLGSSAEWGSDTVVVIDSWTAFGEASLRRSTKQANKTPSNRTSAVWGSAVDNAVAALQIMARADRRYHLVILAHLKMIGPEDFLKQGDSKTITETKLEAIQQDMIPTRLFPVSVTKPSSQLIHKELTTMVLMEQKVKLGRRVRVLRTTSDLPLDLKVPAKKVPDELPIETGLATLFGVLGAKAPGL